MSARKNAVRLTGCILLGAAAACADGGAPTTDPGSILEQIQAPDLRTLTQSIPGFGGLFIDRGIPTVYLTDPGQRGIAERMLNGFARARGVPGIEVRAARFAYRDLDRWTQAVSYDAFAQGGVVFVDLDEASNRVLVGVERGTSHANIRSLAARLKVPAEAIEVRDVDPIQFAATLRDQVRPVVAGLQIHFGMFVCSIGFNASSGGQASFVTASHCTDRQGGVEGTEYFQPLRSTANSFIGTEVADPEYTRNSPGCPRGARCRRSDAARAAYASAVPFTLGGIAQTTGPNNGSLTIAGTFKIAGEGGEVVGDIANKVGRTTGWTFGPVIATCINSIVLGAEKPIIQLCQTRVRAGVAGGDSGSPVFRPQGGGDRATLLGILWGGSVSGEVTFVFSPMFNIERELGLLTTHK